MQVPGRLQDMREDCEKINLKDMHAMYCQISQIIDNG